VLHTGRIDDPALKSIYLEYKQALLEGGLNDRLSKPICVTWVSSSMINFLPEWG
jgi:hypothetical protein